MPQVCLSKHTKRKPPVLSVNTPKHRHMHCHLDYAMPFCGIEKISSNPAEVFLAQRRGLSCEGRRSLHVPWRIRFSQCVKFLTGKTKEFYSFGFAVTKFELQDLNGALFPDIFTMLKV